ncbi:MAG: hypothetical protein JO345_29260 [Streptosporangiaceae bacterium]|nr:hypothetical protein [Streptosporangiaceae bacterium]
MSTVTFGDLLRAAAERLDAAEAAVGDAAAYAATAQDLRWLVGVLSRHSANSIDKHADLAWTDASPWERAASDVREALDLAASFLVRGLAARGRSESAADYLETRPLAPAATTLAAAHDLLNTHYDLLDDGERSGRTVWAQVIDSAPVRRAMTSETGRWSARLAPWARWLAQSDDAAAHGYADVLTVASRYLWLAGTVVERAETAEPLNPDDRTLLYGIPAAAPPTRVPPKDGEPVAELCAGMACTAERLRLAAFTGASHAAWSPVLTASAWEHAAKGAAITMDTAELTLRVLAKGITAPVDSARILGAAETLTRARDAWLRAASTWTAITTETRFRVTPADTETSDLMLRMGRLAFDNPRWTPERAHRSSRPRDPSALAQSDVGAAQVIAAVHDAVDALAVMAAQDLVGITKAADVGRFYVPTRSLSAAFDVRRPYAPAPKQRTDELLDAYRATVEAGENGAESLGGTTLEMDAPSRVLALARRATRSPHTADRPGGQDPAERVTDASASQLGPVGKAIHELGVRDPTLLLRASALDRVAQSLILQANADKPNDPAKTASRLAAKDRLSATADPRATRSREPVPRRAQQDSRRRHTNGRGRAS